MPTHLFHYRVPERNDGTAHVFHLPPGVAYRLRNTLLAAGAIDPEDAVPGELIHFRELYDDSPNGALHVWPDDILATVQAWHRRVPGVEVHPPRGLSEEERTQLISTIRRPVDKEVVALPLPRLNAEELVEAFVTWAERAARKAGGIVVVP